MCEGQRAVVISVGQMSGRLVRKFVMARVSASAGVYVVEFLWCGVSAHLRRSMGCGNQCGSDELSFGEEVCNTRCEFISRCECG